MSYLIRCGSRPAGSETGLQMMCVCRTNRRAGWDDVKGSDKTLSLLIDLI